MLSAAELAWCRETHEQVMLDACSIRHPGGTPGAFDPNTGNTPMVPHQPFYDGPCAVADDQAASREVLVAEQEIAQRVTIVRIPWSVTEVARGDLLTVTGSADPMLSERGDMTVTDVQASSFATARRLLCTWR